MGAGEEEGDLSNPRGSEPPSVASSIPPRPCQNPPDSSPHYLHISGLAPPPHEAEMEGLIKEERTEEHSGQYKHEFPASHGYTENMWGTRECV